MEVGLRVIISPAFEMLQDHVKFFSALSEPPSRQITPQDTSNVCFVDYADMSPTLRETDTCETSWRHTLRSEIYKGRAYKSSTGRPSETSIPTTPFVTYYDLTGARIKLPSAFHAQQGPERKSLEQQVGLFISHLEYQQVGNVEKTMPPAKAPTCPFRRFF